MAQCMNQAVLVEHDHCLSVISSKSSDSSTNNKTVNTSSTTTEDVDVEDGPLFRATIKELESRTNALKGHLKRILKAATSAFEAEQALLAQDKALVQALREAPFSELLFTHYLDGTWASLHEQRERLLLCMQTLLIRPLQKLYELDIKTADQKRRQFEDVSKDYYANLAKYLSIKSPSSKTKHSEIKFLNKKRDFDLIRFDYYSFLMDLHGGKKQHEILYRLLSHYEKQYAYHQETASSLSPFQHGLDTLANIMQEASREQSVLFKERNEKRKLLVSKYNNENGDPPLFAEAEGLGIASPDYYLFKNIRDLEQQQPDSMTTYGRRKEGFLFATSKPVKNNAFDMPAAVNWHKYWCVLSGGQLHEYSNWKRHLETHNEPIHLRCAAVREARNTDRRFCFEIITPHFKRIYQATSNEELNCWIATINNAISGLLNGMSSSVDLKKDDTTTPNNNKWRHNRSLSGALSGLTAAAKDKYRKRRQRNQSTTIPTMAAMIPDPSLLNKLRQHDPSNQLCADCSARDPEWCSLNLGIVICIECSGIHRSLGTHISKVRSLLLDNATFTVDIVQLLYAIGNATSNTVWAHTPHERPQPTDTRESKLKYIQSKYVERRFVRPTETDPNTLLFDAIDTDDIPKALHAIAIDPQVVNQPKPSSASDTHTLSLPLLDSHGNEYLDRTLEVSVSGSSLDHHRQLHTVRYPLHFALLHGYPKHIMLQQPEEERRKSGQHSRCSSSSSSSSSSSYYSPVEEDGPRIFPMAEFLFQNGADVYIEDEATGQLLADLIGMGNMVEMDAIEYLNMKNGLRGQSPITRSNGRLVNS